MTKQNGILLHISSLPSKYGIGSLGLEAFKFIDFLSDCGVDFWQILPIGQTSFGDSPYQSLSAFAGNPYFIDLEILSSDGLLSSDEIANERVSTGRVDFSLLFERRFSTLRVAFARFKPDNTYTNFVVDNSYWLDDYALFMALKTKFAFTEWRAWPSCFKFKSKLTSEHICALECETNFWKFIQFCFDAQMRNLVKYAKSKGVGIISDMPIYVANDSADVWANPKLFQLDKNLNPKFVAGVPPDYFAKDGQLWGNPLYNWNALEKTDYKWWHDRILHSLTYCDKIRIDHFRGFESYYKVPFGAENAVLGEWIKGSKLKMFKGIWNEVSGRIIAEDLGIITDSVRRLLKKSGFPGMKVLQFAFDGKPNNEYLPRNVKNENTVYYTGTHDNNTLKGWYDEADIKTRALYLSEVKPKTETPIEAGIRAVMSSRADLVVVPMQDYLGLGAEARMNIPSTSVGNWTWQMNDDYVNIAKSVRKFTLLRNK
ncbi:MAG: 4-alpha-glucanotransferase [Clostridia bacterium]